MDRIGFCNLLRRIPEYSECPIITVTAMTDKTFIDQACAAGATDYATKSFDGEKLTTRPGLAAKSIE